MQSKFVLVVEDDPAILIDAAAVFEDAGIPVVTFNNADDALAHIYDRPEDVSAIFTDLQMPGRMDGLLLAEIVGRHWPKVRVLLTSGRVQPMGRLPGNVRFLPKPWVREQVLDALAVATDEARHA